MSSYEPIYKQTVTIGDEDGYVLINACEKTEQTKHVENVEQAEQKAQKTSTTDDADIVIPEIDTNITVFFNGDEYRDNYKLQINKLKRLQSGLRNKMSLTHSLLIDRSGNIRIKIQHPFMDEFDVYILRRQNKEVSVTSMFESRLKNVEHISQKEYVVSMDMMGPFCRPKFNMSLEEVKQKMDIVHKSTNTNGIGWELEDLRNYYTIKHVHQKEAPVGSKNQLVYSGMLIDVHDKCYLDHERDAGKDGQIVGYPHQNHELKSRDEISEAYKFEFIDNIYTVLTKKYKDNVVAIVQKNGSNIIIKFINSYSFTDISTGREVPSTFNPTHDILNGTIDIKDNKILESKISQNESGDEFKCDEETFYEHLYVMEFPFHIPDGIYKHRWSCEPLLIKNNRLYIGIEKIKNGMYDSSLDTCVDEEDLFETGKYENTSSVNYSYNRLEFNLD